MDWESKKDNARLSFSDIGEQVELYRAAVKNRMDVLEKDSINRGYQMIINSKSVLTGVNSCLM